ncbi:MAG: energy-coupling factor ABC transporter ATP-binding protein [Promethearchaeota archaeon]
MSLVKFNNFYFRYKGNKNYALKNINLEIKPNSFVLLAGETGSGKTTLIRCMNGLIPQFYTGSFRGNVKVMGKDTIKTSIADLSTEVGIVFQNPENQLIAMTVEHELAFGLENLGIDPKEIKKRIEKVVKLTQIEKLLKKAPFELSGGEQQRVAIASILILEPKIIILDEPTASLDPLYAKTILNLLKEIQVKKKITVIISEHRLDLVLPLVDEIILMKEGEIIISGAKQDILLSDEFKYLNINKPIIYSLFKDLNLKENYVPTSIEEALQFTIEKLGETSHE